MLLPIVNETGFSGENETGKIPYLDRIEEFMAGSHFVKKFIREPKAAILSKRWF